MEKEGKLHEFFKIRQLHMAAYFVAVGHELVGVEDDASSCKLFVFKKTPKLLDDRIDYFDNAAAPAQTLFYSLREVKGALYNAKQRDKFQGGPDEQNI